MRNDAHRTLRILDTERQIFFVFQKKENILDIVTPGDKKKQNNNGL